MNGFSRVLAQGVQIHTQTFSSLVIMGKLFNPLDLFPLLENGSKSDRYFAGYLEKLEAVMIVISAVARTLHYT